MQVTAWPIDQPKPYSKNARKLGEQAIAKVAVSLQQFGWRQPIVVDAKGVIICGHTRLLAAKSLGYREVPVHVADNLTPEQVKAYRLMDNRSHQETDWDDDLLRMELLDLKSLDFDLSLTGFDLSELDNYLAGDAAVEGLTDEDAVPEVAEQAVSRAGDLWCLGKHRLLCGDATVSGNVALLMGEDTADAVFTDPPYNVDYEGYTDQKLKIKGDRMSADAFRQFLEASFRSYRSVVKPGASVYVCHPSSWQREFQNALEVAGFEVRCQIIWAKNTFAWGFGRYKFQHEPIFYCHVEGQKDSWYGDKSQSTLWQEKKPAANRLHPTMKPVELVERALANSSKAGDVVADFFGGAGSTLIACQRRDRNCRLMELDPLYADVIIRRWQEYTGKAATLEGRRFDEIARERQEVAA